MEQPKIESLTLSVQEASAIVGCSTRFFYGLCRRDDCQFAVHFGRKIRVVRSELERFLIEQAQAGIGR